MKVINEIQDEIKKIKEKDINGAPLNEQDMEVLLLAALMEEENYGSNQSRGKE